MTPADARRFLDRYDRGEQLAACRHGHIFCSTSEGGICSEDALAVLRGERVLRALDDAATAPETEVDIPIGGGCLIEPRPWTTIHHDGHGRVVLRQGQLEDRR